MNTTTDYMNGLEARIKVLCAELIEAKARIKELEAQASSFEAAMAELVRRHGETHDRLCAVIDAARQQGGAK